MGIEVLRLRQNTKLIIMATSTKVQHNESLALWKVKLQLAAEGSYQAIQQLKEHVLEQTDQDHPIFKQSFYDILQQGYELHFLQPPSPFPKSFETFKDLPLFFLVSGAVEVKCINLEGDNQTVSTTKTKGLITVEQPALAKKYGEHSVNLLTKFQIFPTEPSIVLEILGSNKLLEIMKRKQITEKENNIMRRFMIFPSKEVVRVTVNPMNQQHIKDRLYLLSGRACFYLDDEKAFGKKLILACYEEGYLNPKQFSNSEQSSSSIPSSFNMKQKPKQGKDQKNQKVNLYIFENSEVMYLEQNFLKDDLVKAIELKRTRHINDILDRYKLLRENSEAIDNAQNQLIMRFKLNKKQINCHIHKLVEAKKDKGFMTAKEPMNQKKLKTRTDLISTSSSMKCSIRIRKSKKIV